ncbi:MAG: hypothetical protein WBS18_07910 [Candidatus Acidiferrales bacterium]
MNRATLTLLAVFFLAAPCALPAHAQTQSNSGSAAPAGAAAPAAAQSATQNPPAAAANPAASAAPDTAPAKKVWTNEDIGGLRGDSAISTFQPKNAKKNQSARASNAPPKTRDAAWYRAQITKLQQEIPPLDTKIAQLQAGINGTTVNNPNTSTRPYHGVGFGSWQAQLDDAKQKRSELLSRIGSLEDQARQSGIDANQIP